MKYHIVIFVTYLLMCHAKTVKKTTKSQEVAKSDKLGTPTGNKLTSSAIVAIEIVDDDVEDDSAVSKNTKRTIESSLGYGYHNSLGSAAKPKFEIYKYSQHDIPPYKGDQKEYYKSLLRNDNSNNHHHHHHQAPDNQFQIQKSVTYDLGTRTQHLPASNHHKSHGHQDSGNYQPGITLFTTLDQRGHVGPVSEHLPAQAYQSMSGQVPIIVLRVYTNQLSNAQDLYPNLPQSHPYSSLNAINLQSLLTDYMSAMVDHAPQTYQQHAHYPEYVQEQNLQTHENYPDDAHTRVIFHKEPKQHHHGKQAEVYYNAPTHNYQTQTAAQSYMYVSPEVEAPPQYYYMQPEQQGYYQQQQYVYQEPVQHSAPVEHIQTENLYNYHHHSVPQGQVELLTHEGKGPTYLPTPTRKARQSKKSKEAAKSKSENV